MWKKLIVEIHSSVSIRCVNNYHAEDFCLFEATVHNMYFSTIDSSWEGPMQFLLFLPCCFLGRYSTFTLESDNPCDIHGNPGWGRTLVGRPQRDEGETVARAYSGTTRPQCNKVMWDAHSGQCVMWDACSGTRERQWLGHTQELLDLNVTR